MLYVFGCLASQGPPIWWASKHRRHHKYCDTSKDPHSPVAFNKLYAWLGWAYLPNSEGPFGSGIDEDLVQDLLKYPELVLGENLYWVIIWSVHAAFFAVGGIGAMVYVSMLSGVLCQLLTLYFNVMFHENDHTTGDCKAQDLPYDPLANLYGEAYHQWHHVHPRAYKRPGIDAPYWIFIKPALALGLFKGENKLGEAKLS
ncbi:hypothetical protein CYMTET_21446 [Cymbomonas tetramitiformis]|uniref:Fatty acid desaturase domain-containing protein n=1 Tax=Cymbomonas tetramitiformis TaxID=36881 RepID=A0AAE0G1W7_9CHLO|nr:hypothetical protein CYMTET_21446 [Cymbomonas tetramitiformis]